MQAALRAVLCLVAVFLHLSPAQAQDQVWLQIEAQPTLEVAQERAFAYSTAFPETNGFQLRSGWYAIVLGPYSVAEGAARLNFLRSEMMIPADSYIAVASDFTAQFWPQESFAIDPGVTGLPLIEPDVEGVTIPDIDTAPLALETPEADPESLATHEEPPAPISPEIYEPEETLAEARASEAALSLEDRQLLQTALQWFGYYSGGIDGAFGSGTRNSMANWQAAMAIEPTGVLTSRQRATLVANYQAEVTEFGFAAVEEAEAGIQATLPLALVEFDRYQPPFVHYRAKNGSDLSLVLISQPGDKAALAGLYDILQRLDAMPATGARELTEKSFRIHGTSASQDSHAWAQQSNSTVKGFMLVGTPENAARDARLREVLEASFRSTGSTALDPGMVALSDSTRRGLLAGLELRRPAFSRSGFYVDETGSVLTSAAAVEACSRITLDHETEAKVSASAEGLALLTPATRLAPPATARFQTAPDRLGAEIAVAGYSYEDRLPAPVLTFGTFEASEGLRGEAGINRLALTALPGDAGGPVLDESGAVTGLLLPEASVGAQQLPAGTSFAASAATLTAFLQSAGVTPAQSELTERLAPVKLTEAATGMTVLVSCWQD
ncbi:serine protease [Xinfangfangia sp. CPCC 101601]|uniref:Serine protease n=1 Tax=Pseudogemmobacter lacusdianii TaxID=3069608 RepID=A0ABU0VXC8_9RHOB|nr:serine protease [Xinfangfangia sp. CPCC 101601]MDQ2065845.1 serine protease [Xinfangfangia sp. CPCC 101601]